MSTGYMYHKYDLRTGDWMMILISTGDFTGSDVNKDLTFKDKDKDQTFKAKDQDKDYIINTELNWRK